MKSIWIFNHYAGPPSISTGLRHYYFAKHLDISGYNTTIFSASSIHNSNTNLISDRKKYIKGNYDDVSFVFIKTSNYKGNGLSRLKNMIEYYLRLFTVTKYFPKPHVIIGSSVHPLACIAAIKLSKIYKCKCIVEIRDLWPESIITYGSLKKNGLLARILYLGEKWIYKKAGKIIFTMEGGKDYIIEKGWDKVIDLNKIHHINNGIDLNRFDNNKNTYLLNDVDLDNEKTFRVIYVGSIRKVNSLGQIISVANVLKINGFNEIKILVYGDGDELDELKSKCGAMFLDNIVFKGYIEKKFIPYILSKADLNLVHVKQTDIMRFGCSLNKLFDYFASGKPILSDLVVAYDLVQKYNAGITVKSQDIETIANGIIDFYNMDKETLRRIGINARKAAEDYDFRILKSKLVDVINS